MRDPAQSQALLECAFPEPKRGRRSFFAAAGLVTVLVASATLLTFRQAATSCQPSPITVISSDRPRILSRRISTQELLFEAALDEVLSRGSPLLGSDTGCSKKNATCNWMAKVHDKTKLVDMNLPGTHDSATGNYSDATQAALIRYTGPNIPSAQTFRCQEQSLFQMLNDGIRVFDLRFAYNPGNDTIGFYHSSALLAPTTSIVDVLYGYYSWLEAHPSETVLLSFNHESGTGTVEDERLQEMIFNIFSKPSADKTHLNNLKRKFWFQDRGELGTLGQARGKAILLQRFSYSQLQTAPDPSLLTGLDLESGWTDNDDNIQLVYNSTTNATVFIEDRYQITLPSTTVPSIDAYITSKFSFITAHLQNAIQPTGAGADQLWITFASAAFQQDPTDSQVTMYPSTYALGQDDVQGINKRLLPWLQAQQGKRFGIIMLDFYDSEPGLIEAVLGL